MDILLLGIIKLQHVFQTIASGFNDAFWWYGPLSEDREKIIYKSTKTILWL